MPINTVSLTLYHAQFVIFYVYRGYKNAQELIRTPFHRGIEVSIDRHLDDSDVNLVTSILFYLHTPARFYLSVELGFVSCFLQFMHICHARHYSTVRNVHYHLYRKRRRKNATDFCYGTKPIVSTIDAIHFFL